MSLKLWFSIVVLLSSFSCFAVNIGDMVPCNDGRPVVSPSIYAPCNGLPHGTLIPYAGENKSTSSSSNNNSGSSNTNNKTRACTDLVLGPGLPECPCGSSQEGTQLNPNQCKANQNKLANTNGTSNNSNVSSNNSNSNKVLYPDPHFSGVSAPENCCAGLTLGGSCTPDPRCVNHPNHPQYTSYMASLNKGKNNNTSQNSGSGPAPASTTSGGSSAVCDPTLRQQYIDKYLIFEAMLIEAHDQRLKDLGCK